MKTGIITVVHDFNGHEVNGIHGLYGKKGYDKALYSVNKRHDITGIHGINRNFPYDHIFRKIMHDCIISAIGSESK